MAEVAEEAVTLQMKFASLKLLALVVTAAAGAAAQQVTGTPECQAFEQFVANIIDAQFPAPPEVLDTFSITFRPQACIDVPECAPENIVSPADTECMTNCCGTTSGDSIPNICYNGCEELIALIADQPIDPETLANLPNPLGDLVDGSGSAGTSDMPAAETGGAPDAGASGMAGEEDAAAGMADAAAGEEDTAVATADATVDMTDSAETMDDAAADTTPVVAAAPSAASAARTTAAVLVGAAVAATQLL